MFIKLLKLKPRRRHRGAHRTAHRWEPCEVAGSSKFSDLRICVTTRWSGRRGIASCVEDLHTMAAVVRRGRVKIPRIHLKIHRGKCRVRVVVRRGFQKALSTLNFRCCFPAKDLCLGRASSLPLARPPNAPSRFPAPCPTPRIDASRPSTRTYHPAQETPR